MGLLFEQKTETIEDTAPTARTAIRKITKRTPKSTIINGARGCDNCPLQETWHRLSSPRMQTTTFTKRHDILVLGEAPGETEDKKNEQFVGETGNLLRDEIPGRWQDRMAFQNTIRCHPYKNRDPEAQEIHACGQYLDDDIERLGIKAILGVGAIPLSRYIPRNVTTILRYHGTRFPISVNGRALWYYPVMHPSFVKRNWGKFDEGRAYPVWRADIARFLREVDLWPTPDIWDLRKDMVIIPVNREEAEALVAKMSGPVAVDIETNHLRPYAKGARILCASISDGDTTIAFPINHPEAQTEWGLDFLLTVVETRHWIAHNATFELAWFLYHSAQLGRSKELNIFEDTMALARLYHARETILSLEILSRTHLGVNVKDILNINTRRILEYPIIDVLRYCGLDSMATAPLYHMLIRAVNREHYERLLERIESFTMMQLYGLDVSRDEAMALDEEWLKKEEAAAAKAHNTHEVKQYERVHGEFNIGAPKQVGEALVEFGHVPLPKTDGGKQYITDDETLGNLAPDNPLVKSTLAFREANKIRGTYIEPLIRIPTETEDGRLHPCYSPLLVATYRSQSEDPNSQNFPSRKHRELRRPVVAPDGHVFVACDYGQLQVRILVMASNDHKLKNDLLNDEDIHSQWLNNLIEIEPNYLDRLSEETNEIDEKKIRKAGRNIIKSDFVFNSFFGGGIDSISRRTGVAEKKVRALQGWFWEDYKEVHAWHKIKRREYKDKGVITMFNGLVRRGMASGNEPINYPIQDGEAEIVLSAQSELSRLSLKRNDIYLHPRINIHDDLTFICPDDDRLPGYIETIAQRMIKVRFPWQNVPLTLEVKIGPNWAELEEMALFKGDYVHGRTT